MKKLIVKIPIVGKFIFRVKRRLGNNNFTSTQDYWIKRYKRGGNSGEGSYNHFAEYKGDIVNEFVKKNNIQSVIEFGCGDGNQLSYFKIPFFIGYEISPEALDFCRKKFESDRTKEFYHYDDRKNFKADLTMSLDVIYCLVETETYEEYMQRLFESSGKYVMIYSSNQEASDVMAPHIRHRKFTNWVDKHQQDFKLISHNPNKFEKQVAKSSNSEWFIFERKTD